MNDFWYNDNDSIIDLQLYDIFVYTTGYLVDMTNHCS